MNFVMAYSGGKDSALALHRMIEAGHKPVGLLVTLNKDQQRSWFHGIDRSMLNRIAASLNIPLILCECEGGDDYNKAFEQGLKTAMHQGADYCVFGDIDIEDHFRWGYDRCRAIGVLHWFPLWGENRRALVEEGIRAGFRSVIKCIDSSALPDTFLGKTLSFELLKEMEQLGIDLCGENGEYHTLVVDGPVFSFPIPYQTGEVLHFEKHAAMDIHRSPQDCVADFHVHSNVSFDGHYDIYTFCETAMQNQIDEVCFTEHVEIGHIYQHKSDWDGRPDSVEYTRRLKKAREDFPQLTLRKGLEVGLYPHTLAETAQFIQSCDDLDFVIASQHIANKQDPYSQREYYLGRPVSEVIAEFLQETLLCLEQFDDFDVVGHLSYVSMYAPNPHAVEYEDYPELYDAILKSAASRSKGIELNTVSQYVYRKPMAAFSVLKRFRELGGEIVTIGSDAHFTVSLGHWFDAARMLLKDAGYKYFCTFEKRQPVFRPLL